MNIEDIDIVLERDDPELKEIRKKILSSFSRCIEKEMAAKSNGAKIGNVDEHPINSTCFPKEPCKGGKSLEPSKDWRTEIPKPDIGDLI